MARHNICFLVGSVIKQPQFVTKDGVDTMGIAFLSVVRGPRVVGDHRKSEKFDKPVIMAETPDKIALMKEWKENDIVFVKGSIATKRIKKSSVCTHCGAKNAVEGVLVCVYPIWTVKIASMSSPEEASEWLIKNKEVSNQVYAIGTLTRDPKRITPKNNLIVTQYQLSIGRKYHFVQDSPEIKADFPWVKSYGDNANKDRDKLHLKSEVYVDGCIQARGVMRHHICEACGQQYDWKDRAMEIVPFETEYLNDYYSEEEVQQHVEERAAQAKRDILKNAEKRQIVRDEEDYTINDNITEQDIKDGFDTMGSSRFDEEE